MKSNKQRKQLIKQLEWDYNIYALRSSVEFFNALVGQNFTVLSAPAGAFYNYVFTTRFKKINLRCLY